MWATTRLYRELHPRLEPKRIPERQRCEARPCHALRAKGVAQIPYGLVDPFGRQLKCAEVHRHTVRGFEIQMSLNGLLGIHVNGPHEPARLIRTDRQKRQIDRAEPLSYIAEERRVRGVAGEINSRVAGRDLESAPERTVLVERTARREVMGGSERDRHLRCRRLLPPIQLLDPAHARPPCQPT